MAGVQRTVGAHSLMQGCQGSFAGKFWPMLMGRVEELGDGHGHRTGAQTKERRARVLYGQATAQGARGWKEGRALYSHLRYGECQQEGNSRLNMKSGAVPCCRPGRELRQVEGCCYFKGDRGGIICWPEWNRRIKGLPVPSGNGNRMGRGDLAKMSHFTDAGTEA